MSKKNILSLFEKSELCQMENLIEQSQNKNSWLIILTLILDKEVQ